MKTLSILFAVVLLSFTVTVKDITYVASTPAHHKVVRNFLGISLTDSIDFIRWKIVLRDNQFELLCKYGIGKPNTPGFIDEKRVSFSGVVKKENNYYTLSNAGKALSIVELNNNVLHLADENKKLLVGNGGWSYALNNVTPVKSNQFNLRAKAMAVKGPLVFEGRTACSELRDLLEKSEACHKLKWYFVLYTDSLTRKPSHYLVNGTGYRKETMGKGKWEIINGKDGKITYKLHQETKYGPLYLLKVDENILIFTDADGNLFAGDENFSYTLNRREKEHPRTRP